MNIKDKHNNSLSSIATAELTKENQIKTVIAGSTGEASKEELLEKLFRSFQTGLNYKRAITPRDYLEAKGLNFNELQIGFNSGQFHHRKDEAFRKPYVEIGILERSNALVNSPEKIPYKIFGNYSIVFPLKDEAGDIVNLYAIRIKKKKGDTSFLNEEGIYPSYPSPTTKRLFIAPTILETASLLQSKALENRDAVISLYDGEYKNGSKTPKSKTDLYNEINKQVTCVKTSK